MILRRIRLFRLVTVKNLFLIRAGNEPSQARLGSVWLAHSATRAWLGSASERAHKIGLVRFVIGSRATATCMTVAAMDGRRAVGGGYGRDESRQEWAVAMDGWRLVSSPWSSSRWVVLGLGHWRLGFGLGL